MTIERAIPTDHDVLTAITKRSKAYWGYSQEQLQEWDALLTFTPEYITNTETYKLVSEGVAIGYYSVFVADPQTLKLDNLFIVPEFISKGFGKKLMEHLFEKAALYKCAAILLDSDPNAESFYSRFGFVTIGQIENAHKTRFLPVMKKSL
ncbi:GNAT family N-acetyltransferase [Flavobacterium sp.]|uniref:GNAT family N-acetyltransferase n=2 Tax=Flavobacterium sp. TaxID=239 RepID=UPI00403400F1